MMAVGLSPLAKNIGALTDSRSALLRIVFLLYLLSACGSLPDAPSSASHEPQQADRHAQVLSVAGEESQIVIYVYRAGALAALGHNHIVSSQDIRGRILLTDEPQNSSLELKLPVASFVVDDPELRAASGEDFSRPVDADAIAATRANMLGARMLDAERFPEIRVVSRTIGGTLPDLLVNAAVTIKDQTHSVEIPVTVVSENDSLLVTGEFSLRQSSLGLEPFSLFLGALAVQDELGFRIRLLAR